eukprot:361767-Chlamydomonas_euryale.AAC.17
MARRGKACRVRRRRRRRPLGSMCSAGCCTAASSALSNPADPHGRHSGRGPRGAHADAGQPPRRRDATSSSLSTENAPPPETAFQASRGGAAANAPHTPASAQTCATVAASRRPAAWLRQRRPHLVRILQSSDVPAMVGPHPPRPPLSAPLPKASRLPGEPARRQAVFLATRRSPLGRARCHRPPHASRTPSRKSRPPRLLSLLTPSLVTAPQRSRRQGARQGRRQGAKRRRAAHSGRRRRDHGLSDSSSGHSRRAAGGAVGMPTRALSPSATRGPTPALVVEVSACDRARPARSQLLSSATQARARARCCLRPCCFPCSACVAAVASLRPPPSVS